MKSQPLDICGLKVQPGERLTLALPTPEIYTCAPLHIPMHVIHGKKAGPRVLICATLYGDEANGIDIVHRLLETRLLKTLTGTLICIPVMNVYGLINHTRNLPDGHDLADSFPGSEKGSFAARLAHLFTSEVINLITHCINIRSGLPNIYKLPQVYYHPEDPVATHLAHSFGAPLVRPSGDKTGFFYSEAGAPKCPTLIYEGGEAHRSDEYATKIGLKGILRILKELDMIRIKQSKSTSKNYITAKKTMWLHSPGSGIFQTKKPVGSFVKQGDLLAVITDPFGSLQKYELTSPINGMLSAITTYPHVFEGQQLLELSHTREESDLSLDIPSFEQDIADN